MQKCNVQNQVWVVLSLLIVVFGSAAFLPQAALEVFAADKMIAVVNNDIITQKDLDDFINFTYVQLSREYPEDQVQQKITSIKSDLLDRLIEDRLILQEAKKKDTQIDETRVKEKLSEIRKRYTSEAEFQSSLAVQGLVAADLDKRIREQMLMYTVVETQVRAKININPGEVTDFYYKNIKDFKLPEQREFDSIEAEDEKIAQEVHNKLAAGESLIDLSLKYPVKINKLSARGGGQELRKEIEDAVFNLTIGELSQPVKSEGYFYVFKLNTIIPPKEQSFEEAQHEIYRFIFEKKMQEELLTWVEGLKKQAYIKIL
ncbi:MAG: peptidyl-prolyl cis-trans isomerase [Candidatus Omnitrophota bacterium]